MTGGAGFLGTCVVRKLKERGAGDVFVPRSCEYDLRERPAIRRMYADTQPDLVIHLAARVGGIGANRANPGRYFYENLIMGVQLIHEAKEFGLKKFVAVGTICAYPKYTPAPFREEDLWSGYPEETNAPYGLAKKMLLVQCQTYRQQYGLNSIYLLPVNLYGPGDNFDPETSHVIPATIRKCVEAKRRGDPSISAWGTGSPTREFINVDDCAEGLLLAAERYNKPDPVNLGTGHEITIRDLVALVADVAGFAGKVIWDPSRPDGQPRRCLDTSRAYSEFGFRAKVALRDGIADTLAWYLKNGNRARLAG